MSNHHYSKLVYDLRKAVPEKLKLQCEVSAANLTTFALGGQIGLLAEPQDVDGLLRALEWFWKNGVPWRVLGAGSNVVVCDDGIEEVVIRLGDAFNGVLSWDAEGEFGIRKLQSSNEVTSIPAELGNVHFGESFKILALAGTPLMGLSRRCSNLGLSGLEFAAGIPASLGGAVAMNAGAHGESMGLVVEKVYVVDVEGRLKELSREEMQFSYRETRLGKNDIALGALILLNVGQSDDVLAKRARCLEYRKQTQPLQFPSAGSVFANPTVNGGQLETDSKLRYAAYLLEKVGMKGVECGGVAYSSMHANWLVKIRDDAKASEVACLMAKGQERVLQEFGIELRPEIIFWKSDR